jgi:hypothetical protein
MILEPFGPLIYQGEISEDFLSYLRAASATSHEDVGKLLAGHLRDQRLADANPKKFFDFIYPHVKEYLQENVKRQKKHLQKYDPPSLNTIQFNLGNGPWINYQHKNEFNPLHSHSGDLSAVIMIDVPEEISKEPKFGNCPSVGMLEFVYSNPGFFFSGSHKIVPETGQIFLFPADLKHCVYPFQSDVTRISMSFNVCDLQFD